MTYSPLVDLRLPPTSDKQSSRGGRTPNGLIVHHWATTSMAGRDRLVYSSDPASANYLIYDDGTLVGSVPEEYRAWTSSSYAADDDKITVEIQNSTLGPEWRVSDAAFATLVRLYADVAARYGFTPSRGRIFGHRDFHATACPGPYLYPRLDDVARRAAALHEEKDWFTMATKDDLRDSLLDALDSHKGRRLLADAVWRTDIIPAPDDTNTEKNPTWFAQSYLPNIRWHVKDIKAHMAALGAALDTLANDKGVDPAEIKAAVSRAVEKALDDVSITLTNEEEV